MDEEIDVKVTVEQLATAGTNPSGQVSPLFKLGEWYLKKAKATASGVDFTKADALYNAALVRSKLVNHEIDEEQILQRIVETYREFLYAFGNETNVGVDEIFSEINYHKKFLANEREIYRACLNEIDSSFNRKVTTKDHYEIHADKMHDVFHDIQNMYTRLVSMLAKECESRLGQPPCDYAIIALGSVARMEATPYSDLEFAILYSDPALGEKISYFRIMSHFLHLKVINLGETILPAMGIEQLNNFESTDPNANWFYDSETPRGISFDAAMPWASKTPLGRKATKNKPALELIRTPEQMAEFQDEEIAIKEGYHLADILSRVALLYGDQALVEEYNECVAEKLNTNLSAAAGGSSSTVGLNRGIQQLLYDITTYDPYDSCLGLPSTTGAVFHAKKDFYRLISLLLSDLGLIFDIRSPSSWQVISELQTRGIISESEMANIKVCLSIANEIRLKTYFGKEGQKEVLSPVPRYAKTAEQHSANSSNGSTDSLNGCTDAPFFPDFDEDIIVRLLSTSFDMHQRCQGFCLSYNQNDEVDISILQNPPLQFSKRSLVGHLYFRLQNFPKALESMESVSEGSTDYPASLYGQGVIYLHRQEYRKSVEYLEKALEAHYQNEEMSNLNVLQGMCSLAMALLLSDEHEKAKTMLEEAIIKHDEIYGQGCQTIELCRLMRRLGSAYVNLGDTRLALETFKKVKEMQNSLNGVPDNEIINTNFQMAFSLTKIGQHSQSLEYVERALRLSHKLLGKGNLSIELASIYMGAAVVYERCNRSDEALSWYERSLELFHVLFGEKPCQGKIVCFMQLGVLYSQRLETGKAVENLQNALEEARTFYHGRPHFLQALVLMSLGEVMKQHKKFQDSLRYFQEAKEIMDTFSGSIRADPLASKILYSIGTIYDDLGNLAKSLQYYEDTISIYSAIYGGDDVNENVAVVSAKIACVAERMGDFIKAKDYFTKGVKIYRKIPLTKGACSCAVASLFRLSSICEVLGEQDEALQHLEEAREIAKVNSFKNLMVLDVLHRLSKKYNEMGTFAKFVICFEEAIEMAKSVPEDEPIPPSLLEVIEILKN